MKKGTSISMTWTFTPESLINWSQWKFSLGATSRLRLLRCYCCGGYNFRYCKACWICSGCEKAKIDIFCSFFSSAGVAAFAWSAMIRVSVREATLVRSPASARTLLISFASDNSTVDCVFLSAFTSWRWRYSYKDDKSIAELLKLWDILLLWN